MPTPLRTRTLIADDHPIVRRGLRAVLEREPDFEVVEEAADGAAAVERAVETEADLVIMDVSMPRLTGLQATRELNRRAPDVRVLMLSMHDDEQYLFEALKAGAAGYVLKAAVDRDLLTACRAVMRGEPFLYPEALATLVRDRLDGLARGEDVAPSVLTPREEEVVKLIAEANSNEQIAEALVISVKTVERHRENILAKLGMHDRVQLTRYAIRRGLVQP